MRRIGGSLLSTVRKVLGADHPDLDEVTREATLAVLQALPRFGGTSSISQFARCVALLAALRVHRRLPVVTGVTRSVGTDVDNISASTAKSRYIEPLSQQRRELTRHLLAELSEPTAEVLGLHCLLGLTLEEIATLLGLSSNAAWRHLREGKRALRKALEGRAELLDVVRSRQ